MWKKGNPTLTIDDLKMCLKREVKTEDDMQKFMIYWEELLPIHVGKSLWSAKERYYCTISNAMNPLAVTNKLQLITPEHEAFMVLSIENHLERWKKNFNKGKDEGKDDNDTNSGLYTSTTSGQNQYGGWSPEGCELYNDYVEMITKAREHKNNEVLEKKCLQNLREKYNIRTENFIDHQKMLNRKKNALKRGRPEEPMPPMKKIVRTFTRDRPGKNNNNNNVEKKKNGNDEDEEGSNATMKDKDEGKEDEGENSSDDTDSDESD
jgi:hypothetical protein